MALWALLLTPAAHGQTPAWFDAVRAAAVGRALEPLGGEALTAAEVEVARARASGMPQLHLSERSRLGLDASYTLRLEAGASVPLWAPAAIADRRLSDERLAATRQQMAAERRAELHDALAQAVALLAARARARALEALDAALRDAGPDPRVAPPLHLTDVRLLAAGRGAQRRRAEALRQTLAATLAVRIPEATLGAGADGRRRGVAPAPEAARDPLGFPAGRLDPARCAAASDSVTRARLAGRDVRLSAALARARSQSRVDLDLGAGASLGDALQDPSYTLRLGLSVALPAWSPAEGAASLAVGAAGLEQSLTARWPNRTPSAAPSPEPAAKAAAEVRDAARAVRQRLALLTGQEADLTVRRRILADGLAQRRREGLAGAYRTATLALQLADVDEALGITRLDAALLCAALPP